MLAMLCANPAAMNVVASKTTPSSLSMIVRPARSQGSPERWPGCIARTTHGTGDRAWRRPRPPPTPQTRSPPAPPAAAVDHSHDDSAPASLPRRIWQNPPAPPELQLRGGSPDRRADQKAVWTELLPHLPWRRTDSPGVEAGHRSPPSLPAKRERAFCQTLLEGGAVDDVAAAGLDVAVVGVLDDRDPLGAAVAEAVAAEGAGDALVFAQPGQVLADAGEVDQQCAVAEAGGSLDRVEEDRRGVVAVFPERPGRRLPVGLLVGGEDLLGCLAGALVGSARAPRPGTWRPPPPGRGQLWAVRWKPGL